MKTYASILGLFLCGVLASCGGTSGSISGNGGGGGNPPSNVQGMWSVNTLSNSGNPPFVIYANLTQTGDSFFEAANSIVDCTPSGTDLEDDCQGGNGAMLVVTGGGGSADAINGTVTSTGEVQITLSLAACSPSVGCTVTATGNLSGSQMTGTYTSSAGDTGSFQATLQPSVSGTYTGSMTNLGGGLPMSMTLNLTQNADYSLSGTATLTNCPVIQSFTIAQGNVIGGAVAITVPGLSNFPNNIPISFTPVGADVAFQIVGSSSTCFGSGNLTKQ
jgi:hypothetical protein